MGRIPRPSVVGQQIIHRIREALVVELLNKSNRVTACLVGISFPGFTVLDTETVHFFGNVVAANPFDAVSQMGQQFRQIRFAGNGHLRVCKAVCNGSLSYGGSPPSENAKQPPEYPLFTVGYTGRRFSYCFLLLSRHTGSHGLDVAGQVPVRCWEPSAVSPPSQVLTLA